MKPDNRAGSYRRCAATFDSAASIAGLIDYPHALLALQIAHVGDFFLGSSTMLRDRIAQVLPAWGPHQG